MRKLQKYVIQAMPHFPLHSVLGKFSFENQSELTECEAQVVCLNAGVYGSVIKSLCIQIKGFMRKFMFHTCHEKILSF